MRRMLCGILAFFFSACISAAGAQEPRPTYADPGQVWWDASQSAYVVLKAGARKWTIVSTDGKVAGPDEDARDLPPGATVTPQDWSAYFGRDGMRPTAIAFSSGGVVWDLSDDSPDPRKLQRLRLSSKRDSLEILSCLLPGFSNARGVAVTEDGKLAAIAHLLPKSNLPATQIEQGWVFTNALSIWNPDSDELLTLPLDLRTQGFANPEGVALSPDGKWAWVAHAGADIVSVIDLEKARSLVKPGDPLDLTKTRRYVIARVPVGSAPTGLTLSGDGKVVAVANRLSDTVSLIDTQSRKVTHTVALSDLPADSIRRGERLFHSGRISHTGQFSCASCHPDGKTDGLNWDLPADGFNNFQNTKSLHDLGGTAPYGWLGTSTTLEERFTGTLRHLFQYEPTDEEVTDLTAYLRSLKTPPSKPASEAGRKLFEKAGCAECHSGPKLTDAKLHDVLDAGRAYDTPSLVGVRDTAPYLHDGRAPTLESIFRDHNAAGLHGRAAELTEDEIKELMRYLDSL